MHFPVNSPKNPHFHDPERYDIEGVVNFHLTTKDLDEKTTVNIGIWLILPEDEINTTLTTAHGIATAKQILTDTGKPILLYLHGIACNRVLPIPVYKILRQFFIIIAIDHRGNKI